MKAKNFPTDAEILYGFRKTATWFFFLLFVSSLHLHPPGFLFYKFWYGSRGVVLSRMRSRIKLSILAVFSANEGLPFLRCPTAPHVYLSHISDPKWLLFDSHPVLRQKYEVTKLLHTG